MLMRFTVWSLVVMASLHCNACKAQFDLTPPSMSYEDEVARVKTQHPQIVAQSGGVVDNEKLVSYINTVGQKVARNSAMPDKQFVFTTLNSDVVNAWTVGGGHLYITRGMLSVMNSEAELAAVLAHEAGHVTARHSAKRETRMKWTQYQTGLLALLTRSPLLVGTKSLLDSTSGLSYSRSQERQADKLGFETIKKAGYDLDGMTNMLSDLQRYVRLESTMAGRDLEAQTPAWLSDHPSTDERIRRAMISAGLAKITHPNQTRNFADDYLRAIDGMIYGKDPAQGIVKDDVFYHTGLNFAFDVSAEFNIQNTPQAVFGMKGKELVMLFGGEKVTQDQPLDEFVSQLWIKATEGQLGEIDQVSETEINGMQAIIARERVNVSGLLGDVSLDFNTTVYRFDDETVAFMSFVTQADDTVKHMDTIRSLSSSFRKLSDEESAAIQPLRIRIHDVGPKDTLASLSGQMAFVDFQLARFKALNGIETQEQLSKRPFVKIITTTE